MSTAGVTPGEEQVRLADLERTLMHYLDRYGKEHHILAEDLILVMLRVAARSIALNLAGDGDEMLPGAINAAREYLRCETVAMRIMFNAVKAGEWKDWPAEEGHA